jgi:hypothetical protein
VHKFFRTLMGIAAVALIGAVSLVGPARTARAQGTPAQAQKKVKDQGEYDLFNGVTKEADPAKKVALLNTWKEKYPDSDYKLERLVMLIQTYSALQQWPNVVNAAKEALTVDPKDITSLYWITFLTPNLGSASADVLSTGEKAATSLLAAERPATATEADWPNVKKSFDILGHKTMGWILMQRKDNVKAEQEFRDGLKLDANQSEVSYWLGSVILGQQKADRYSEAMYFFARAAAYEGQGALPPQGRTSADQYLSKLYVRYHGDNKGLDDLKAQAKLSPLPPDGFHIETQGELEGKKDEEFKKSNPQLALWVSIKSQLTAADGTQYFDGQLKGAGVPKLRGTVISVNPPTNSKEIVVALSDTTTPEATLQLEEPLVGKPEVGGVIQFEGVPSAFTKSPFMLTFDTEKDKIEGLKVEAPARRPPAKKGAAPAKKQD